MPRAGEDTPWQSFSAVAQSMQDTHWLADVELTSAVMNPNLLLIVLEYKLNPFHAVAIPEFRVPIH